jgi:hypothetical protein
MEEVNFSISKADQADHIEYNQSVSERSHIFLPGSRSERARVDRNIYM